MNGEGIERRQSSTDQDKMDIKRRDGGRQERGVWCYANRSLVLLWRWAALAQGPMSSKTAETGEETFTNSAPRTAGPPDCASGAGDE